MTEPRRAAVIALLAALLAACTASAGTGTGGGAHKVRYDVTGTDATHGVDLTIQGEDGMVQQNDQPIPWSYDRTAATGDFLYVSAQNKGTGEITCTITVDGEQVKTSTSTGEFAICQADGTL